MPFAEFLEEMTSRLNGTAGAFLALTGPGWLPTMDAHRWRGGSDYVVQALPSYQVAICGSTAWRPTSKT